MHPINVRVIHFEVPEARAFHPLCLAGNSALSYTHTVMGLFVALGEPFFVKSLRRVLEQIKDPVLKEDTDRAIRESCTKLLEIYYSLSMQPPVRQCSSFDPTDSIGPAGYWATAT